MQTEILFHLHTDSRSLKNKVQEIMVDYLSRRYSKCNLSMKEFEKKVGKIRRHVIKAIDDVIARVIEIHKKDDNGQIPEPPHDHDPSPNAPISPSISPISESSYDSKSSESILCGSPHDQQASTWFDDEGHSACKSETSKNVTCDSAKMRQVPAGDEVMLFEQDFLPQACTSPLASPENGSVDAADTAESTHHSLRRQVGIISDQNSNCLQHVVISKSQCASSQTSLEV